MKRPYANSHDRLELLLSLSKTEAVLVRHVVCAPAFSSCAWRRARKRCERRSACAIASSTKRATRFADRTAALIRRDICPFDKFCDHLLVIDHAAVNRFGKPKAKIVGAYRLLRQDVAARHGGFYSAGEFDIAPLLARHPGKRFLELGRSCVAAGLSHAAHARSAVARHRALHRALSHRRALSAARAFAGTESVGTRSGAEIPRRTTRPRRTSGGASALAVPHRRRSILPAFPPSMRAAPSPPCRRSSRVICAAAR